MIRSPLNILFHSSISILEHGILQKMPMPRIGGMAGATTLKKQALLNSSQSHTRGQTRLPQQQPLKGHRQVTSSLLENTTNGATQDSFSSSQDCANKPVLSSFTNDPTKSTQAMPPPPPRPVLASSQISVSIKQSNNENTVKSHTLQESKTSSR